MERHREPEWVETGTSKFFLNITSESQAEPFEVGTDGAFPPLTGNGYQRRQSFCTEKQVVTMNSRPFSDGGSFHYCRNRRRSCTRKFRRI